MLNPITTIYRILLKYKKIHTLDYNDKICFMQIAQNIQNHTSTMYIGC